MGEVLDMVLVLDSEGVVPEQATTNRANVDKIVARTIFFIIVLSSGLESGLSTLPRLSRSVNIY